MASSLSGSTGVQSLKNTGYNLVSMANKSPEQMGLFNMGAGSLQQNMPAMLQQLGAMAGGGNPEMWNQLEAPALRQFGELQGQLASRFSGMGSGARRSSGFQNTASGAAASLAEQLQSNRLQLQQGAQDRLMGLYSNLMGQDLSTNALIPKQKPFWQELLISLMQGLGSAGGSFGGLYGAKKAGIF